VASAGPYASLHLAPDRQPRQHPTTQFFTGQMPFLPHNQQRQSTNVMFHAVAAEKLVYLVCHGKASDRRAHWQPDQSQNNECSVLSASAHTTHAYILLYSHSHILAGLAAEWLVCWTQAQKGPGSNRSCPRCCQVTVLGKLFTPIVPLLTKQQNW